MIVIGKLCLCLSIVIGCAWFMRFIYALLCLLIQIFTLVSMALFRKNPAAIVTIGTLEYPINSLHSERHLRTLQLTSFVDYCSVIKAIIAVLTPSTALEVFFKISVFVLFVEYNV